jgi:copper chaperone
MSREITITGMSCGHCEQSVVEALEALDGIDSATADRTTDSATVVGTADSAALLDAVESAGYEATL